MVKTSKARRPVAPAVLAIQLLGQWNRIAGGHVALAAGCSCGVAVPNVRVQDFEEQILEYLHGRHGGGWKSITELLGAIARGSEAGWAGDPAGPAAHFGILRATTQRTVDETVLVLVLFFCLPTPCQGGSEPKPSGGLGFGF